MNYYNEFDPNAAAWLRGLIDAKLIPAGVVDERSITDVLPTELSGYTQCHFFSGIGGWSLALELAGWPSDRPVWTGSCPCQPYSAAGKQKGNADERNLWPEMFRLIRECRPHAIFGEQVESAIAHGWLDGIRADMESEGYAVGDCTLGAHSVGAPHIRQRLYWVGNTNREPAGRNTRGSCPTEDRNGKEIRNDNGSVDAGSGIPERLADSPSIGRGQECPDDRGSDARDGTEERAAGFEHGRKPDRMGHADHAGPQGYHRDGDDGHKSGRFDPQPIGSAWEASRPHLCRDGKHRRIPTLASLFPLADGLSYKLARRGSIRPALLKGAGNAIVPQVAAEFIRAFMETLD